MKITNSITDISILNKPASTKIGYDKTLLVDANYLLSQAMYSFRKDEKYSMTYGNLSGLYGFFTIIRKCIKDYNFNKVILAWDGENGGRQRYLLDNKYKSKRYGKKWFDKTNFTDKELMKLETDHISKKRDRMRIQEYAEYLFIRQFSPEEYDEVEADDVIAQYCKLFHKKENITIYSGDLDLMQLIKYDDVSYLYKNRKNNTMNIVDKFNFTEYFDYHYSNVLTIKILTGDKSDSIDGVPGLGEKTLFSLFPELKERHVMVREVYNRAKEIVNSKKTGVKRYQAILDSKPRFYLNKKLIDLEEPILTESAELNTLQVSMPLDPEGRSMMELEKLMNYDDFLSCYPYDFNSYIGPFNQLITKEKQRYEKFLKNEEEKI